MRERLRGEDTFELLAVALAELAVVPHDLACAVELGARRARTSTEGARLAVQQLQLTQPRPQQTLKPSTRARERHERRRLERKEQRERDPIEQIVG